MDFSMLFSLVDTSKMGGWVRALVGSGLTALLSLDPHLAQYLSPQTQTAFAIAVSGVVVGVWSHLAKVYGK
jgi:hypothetical protein